jgi:hypothetical protein
MDLSQERLAFDPLYREARRVARNLLEGFFKKMDGHKDEARTRILSYPSISQRIKFMDALRKEMLVIMLEHRKKCPREKDPEKCGYEVRYSDVVTFIHGQFEALDPSTSNRHVSPSFSVSQENQVLDLLNTLHERIQSMETNLQNGQHVTYDILSEELNDLPSKLSLGKKDFGSVFLGRIKDVAMKKGIEMALIDPFIEEYKRIIE